MQRIKLPVDTLIVIDRTTRGNINSDRVRNTTPTTIREAFANGWLNASRGTMQFTVELADAAATAAALGYAGVELASGTVHDGSALWVNAFTQYDLDRKSENDAADAVRVAADIVRAERYE